MDMTDSHFEQAKQASPSMMRCGVSEKDFESCIFDKLGR
jgi:hypothetical protein